jgi:hypothetical protein
MHINTLSCIICNKQAADLYNGEPCCYSNECTTTINESSQDA